MIEVIMFYTFLLRYSNLRMMFTILSNLEREKKYDNVYIRILSVNKIN